MIEIFKTNIQDKKQAGFVLSVLRKDLAKAKLNFDLDDPDKILRIDGIDASYSPVVVNIVGNLGFSCEVLN